MSTYKSFQFKGKRNAYFPEGFSVSCPTAYKYWTLAGFFNTQECLAKYLTLTGGGFNQVGEYVDVAAVNNEEIIPNSGIAATNVTPFSITKQSIKYTIRNNYTKDANLTVFRIKPKSLIPDIILEADAVANSTFMGMLSRCIIEGLADKFSGAAAQTNKIAQMHTNNNSVAYPALFEASTAAIELSMVPFVTAFDSSLFGRWFTVTGVEKYHLRPTDVLKLTVHGKPMHFPDGVEPYVANTETVANEFEEYIVFQMCGDIGHVNDYVIADVGNVSATDNAAGIFSAVKQSHHQVMTSEAFLDVYAVKEVEFEVYDAEIMELLTGLETAQMDPFDRNDMRSTVLQSIKDLN